ncbi:MAG: hypothetical protein VX738_09530, partial [Planctomycetota bacterium]|nr:hypothetical protein [Planctomycetota bacterium]
IQSAAKKDALMTAAIFPVIMLLSYIGLVLYYKSVGESGATSLLSEASDGDGDSANDDGDDSELEVTTSEPDKGECCDEEEGGGGG